jgi:oligopeptidase A
MQNPLQQDYTLPPFSEIKPEHVETALDDALDAAKKKVINITENLASPDWQSLIVPMEQLDASIDKVWSPVSHLNSVMNSDELRTAYNACLPKLSQFGTELGQNEDLFKAYKKIS